MCREHPNRSHLSAIMSELQLNDNQECIMGVLVHLRICWAWEVHNSPFSYIKNLNTQQFGCSQL